jgi:MFS family permease
MQSSQTQEIQKRSIKILATVQVLSGVGTAGTVAAGSLLVASISNSETLAGLAQTSSVLGAAAMAIPLSRLTQRGGRRLGLAIGYGLGAFGSLVAITGGTQRSLFLMLVGTFLVGAASASALQARFAATDLALPESRSKQLSLVVWGSTVGAVAGPNLMGPSGAVAESFGLPRLVGPYLLALLTLTLGALVIQAFLKPDPYLLASKFQHGALTKPPLLPLRISLQRIKSEPKSLFSIATIAVGHAVMVSIMVMTPVHMAHVDVTIEVIGLVISIHILGMYAFSPIIGWLSDRLGRVLLIQLGLAILLLSALVSGFSPAGNAVMMGSGLFLLGLGWSCTLIAGSTLLTESVDSDFKSSAQGASDLIMNLTGAVGGALAGVIISLLGYGWLCLISTVPVIILALASLSKKLSSPSLLQ